MQKSNQAKHVVHAFKNTHLHQEMWNAVCVKIEPARYASNVDLVTLATELLSEQPSLRKQKQQQSQPKAIDVYGQQIEPICTDRSCKHKFSVHGYYTHKCKCRNAINYAAGISLKTEA